MAPNAFNNNPQETTTFFKLTFLFTFNSSFYEKNATKKFDGRCSYADMP